MPFEAVAGVLLAGGRARRMGGADKGLLELAGRPILAHVIERAAPQVQTLLLSANGDPARFEAFGLPVAADVIEGQAGPLAGVLTGLEWAAEHECEWLASFAVDAPFLPLDLVERLTAAVTREGADLACAASNGRAHPVFGLWPVALKDALRRAMVEEEMRKVDRWTARYRLATVAFDTEPVDPFFNANRPEDIEQAEKLLARL